jgi:hypothetical protein
MFGDSSFWSWVSHVMKWGGALHLVVPCCMCLHSLRMALTWLIVCYKLFVLVYLVKGVFINLLLNHGVHGLQGIYFFASAQVVSVGCMCSMIVHFLNCICVCDCDGRHKSLIVLSRSVMVRRSHLLAWCYLGTMYMCTTTKTYLQWQDAQTKILF